MAPKGYFDPSKGFYLPAGYYRLVAEDDGGGSGGPGDQTGITSWSSPGETITPTWTIGWQFTVGATDLTLESLRHYGAGSGAAVWRVSLHRYSDGVLMATADITKVQDAWVAESVAAVTLAAGVGYLVSARLVSGAPDFYRNPTGIAYADELSSVSPGAYTTSVTDDMPSSFSGSSQYQPPADFGFTVN